MVEGRRGVSQDRMLQRLLGIFSFDRRFSRQIITEYGCHGGGGRKKQQLQLRREAAGRTHELTKLETDFF
jgi:hypothetical protein